MIPVLLKGCRAVLLVAVVCVRCASSSGAAAVEDRGDITFDPNTGLEWLDLRFTAGRSYDEVLNGWNGYTTANGWRFATRNEVLALFRNIGGEATAQQEKLQAATRALALFGATSTTPDFPRSWMTFDPASDPDLPTASHVPTAVFGFGFLGGGVEGNQGFFLTPGLYPSRDYGSPEIANALVRVVPEPGTYSLLLSGVGAVAVAALRKRNTATFRQRNEDREEGMIVHGAD